MDNSTNALASILLSIAGGLQFAHAFPDGAIVPNDAELKRHLVGKVLSAKIADGTTWRLEYKANGYFFVDTSTGFRSDGQWAAEDGKLCGQLRGRNRSCNEVRIHQEVLHLKRDSGEMIQLIER